MRTEKQKKAAKKNIKKAQEKWQDMTPRQRALAQPEGRERAKPGSTGEGEYYHITVRPKYQFTSFRTDDIGRDGHSQRVAGRRSSGSWATQKWLISKKDAHVKGNTLVADDPKVKEILDNLRGDIERVKGDIFRAKPKRNVPEREKPTKAQRRARNQNIRKAQRARSYENRTKEELYERAKELDIPGRSTMDKSELIKALRNNS